jgi:Na+-translocating ferredoxin:NAD+ oxidoreductase subunit B
MRRERVALIDESRCIGCRRCLDACPVDAIVGAPQLLHTVVEPWCIGCKLCLPPCPVDCIELVPPRSRWTPQLKEGARQRAIQRRERTGRPQPALVLPESRTRREAIAAALERKRAK